MKKNLVSKVATGIILSSMAILSSGCFEGLRQTTENEKTQSVEQQVKYAQRTGNYSPGIVPQVVYKSK